MLIDEFITESSKKNLPLAKLIRRENNIARSSDEAYTFIITGLQMVFPQITDTQLKETITDDDPDGQIDAIHISKENKQISIFEFKHQGGFKFTDIKLFADGIEQCLFNPRQNLDDLAEIVREKIKQARKLIAKRYNVNIYVVRRGNDEAKLQVKELLESLKNNYPLISSYQFLNSNGFKNILMGSKKGQFVWPVKIVLGSKEPTRPADKIIIKEKRGDKIKSVFCRVKLSDIVKLKDDALKKDYDLFDANVRDFKKNKPLSTKIINSIENNPNDFYIFHNGLTFSCKEILPIDAENYHILNPQIINGCQTVNAIYGKYKRKMNDLHLKKASLLCRFYALEENKIEKVCEATNTQLKINLWDLRSNDGIQRILKKALNLKNINYKPKESGSKRSSVFITDLAQWIYSCRFGQPAKAKNKKSELFDIIQHSRNKPPYEKIFDEKLSLETLVRICEIAFFVKGRISKIKNRSFEKDADLHFIAALFKLEDKKWSLGWKFKRSHKIIEDVIQKMRKKYGKDTSYNKIFTKKDETWKEIERKLNVL
jgi:hypothetical protein